MRTSLCTYTRLCTQTGTLNKYLHEHKHYSTSTCTNTRTSIHIQVQYMNECTHEYCTMYMHEYRASSCTSKGKTTIICTPQNYRWQNKKEYKGKTNWAQSALARAVPARPPPWLHSYTIWLLYQPGGTHRPPPFVFISRLLRHSSLRLYGRKYCF